jgi:hypothetical protein
MKVFEIIDESPELLIGALLYYEKEKSFIIELCEGLDEWNAPLLLTSYVKKGIFTIPKDISLLWVHERLIPTGRQNINSILSTHRLKEYDEMKMLEISEGRCSQDNYHIRKTDILPAFVEKRSHRNLKDLVVLNNNRLLCIFADETMKLVDLAKCPPERDITKIMRNSLLFESGKVGCGGYSATFNDSIDIPAHVLYKHGKTLPISFKELLTFSRKNLLDTAACCEELQCSRQNLAYLKEQHIITPIQENVKGSLYLKGDVLKNKW